MILAGLAALFLLALGSGSGAAAQETRSGSITVRHQIIVRMPGNVDPLRGPTGSLVRWSEGRGPACIPSRRVVGAVQMGQSSVDLVLADRQRVRAVLSRRCPALDFYRGFYIDTTDDGRICAGRDSVRSRAGGECEIEQFRALRATRS